MMKYVLTSEEARKTVNLQDYDCMIIDAVLSVVEDDEPLITICEDGYYVEQDTVMSAREQVRIDELLCETELGQYRVDGKLLFTAIEGDKVQEDTE